MGSEMCIRDRRGPAQPDIAVREQGVFILDITHREHLFFVSRARQGCGCAYRAAAALKPAAGKMS